MLLPPSIRKKLILLVLLPALAAGAFLAAEGLTAPLDSIDHPDPSPEAPVDCPWSGQPCVVNPADLGEAEAESIYQAIRGVMQGGYALSDDPVAWSYTRWRRYNAAPFRSAAHGGVYANVYGNGKAAARELGAGPMPEGALIALDSFVVTAERTIRAASLLLMEKMRPGYDPETGDWRYMVITPDGQLSGVGRPADAASALRACSACHNRAPAGQDHLFRPALPSR